MLTDQTGQPGENFKHLAPLFNLQFGDFVVQLNSGQRLNKDGGAAGGAVLDDSRHRPLELSFQGYDITPIALGYDGLLQPAAAPRGMDDFLQGCAEPSLEELQSVSYLPQLGAGRVVNLALRADAVGYGFVNPCQRRDSLGPLLQTAEVGGSLHKLLSNPLSNFYIPLNLQKFLDADHTIFYAALLQGLLYGGAFGEVEGTTAVVVGHELGGEPELIFDQAGIGDRL